MNLCDEHGMPMCRLCANAEREAEKKAKPRYRLKQTKKPRPLTPAQMAKLVSDVQLRDGRCVMIDHHDGMCDGRTDPHHIVAQWTLAAHYNPGHAVFSDTRNIVPLCRHHHNLIERSLAYLPDEVLPQGFDAFLDQYGFRIDYEASIARRVA